jgi:hypothetical protein
MQPHPAAIACSVLPTQDGWGRTGMGIALG